MDWRNKSFFIIAGPGIFILFFGMIFIFSSAYSDTSKTLDGVVVAGIPVGGIEKSEAVQKVDNGLSKINISARHDGQVNNFILEDFGFTLDKTQLENSFAHGRFTRSNNQNIEVPLTFNESKVSDNLYKFFEVKFPANSKVFVSDGKATASEQQDGFRIDEDQLLTVIQSNLLTNPSSVEITTLPLIASEPEITKEVVTQLINNSTFFIEDSFTVDLPQGGSYSFPLENVTSWVKADIVGGEAKLVAIEDRILSDVVEHSVSVEQSPVHEITTEYSSGRQSTISTKGEPGFIIEAANLVAEEFAQNINSNSGFNSFYSSASIPFRNRTLLVNDLGTTDGSNESVMINQTIKYSIETRGDVSADLAEFTSLAKVILNDQRGWTQAGIRFTQVDEGGDFSLILASPEEVDAAAVGCSAMWSCRVRKLVLINDLRWLETSPAWKASGGSVSDYRHMVINHEVGHFLGYGHSKCAGPGQLANVMQQQSINLGGCTFNPWPTASEIAEYN